MARTFGKPHWWLLAVLALVAAGIVLYRSGHSVAQEPAPAAKKPRSAATSGRGKVMVTKPHKGGIARSTTQPGTMESFDYADLYAKVSGYLKTQAVDIGDRVKAGQVIAVIDAPEFPEAVNEAAAAVAQAEAEVTQMEARVTTAKAEYDAAESNVQLAAAELDKATSFLKFREIQYQRIADLFKKNSIEERLVDEKFEQRDSAQAAENSARASIVSSKSQVAAAKARIASAEADVLDAKAKVRLAKAKTARAQVFVDYLKIISPYDGVITRRSFHVGDFIRAADQGGATPLLTVARTDLMRVIVQVPERDVPYTDVGDAAFIEMDALAGQIFSGKVARFANSEDRLTRTMRTEVDVPNPKDRLRDGMFGRVTIQIETGESGMTVPSSAVVPEPQSKKTAVFVVKNGKAHRTLVEIGQDDGSRTEILSGVTLDDLVVVRPSADLTDGAEVETELAAK